MCTSWPAEQHSITIIGEAIINGRAVTADKLSCATMTIVQEVLRRCGPGYLCKDIITDDICCDVSAGGLTASPAAGLLLLTTARDFAYPMTHIEPYLFNRKDSKMSLAQNQSPHTEPQNISRREILTTGAALAAAATGLPLRNTAAAEIEKVVKNGNIKQSVSRWCYNKIPFEKFCEICKKLGLVGIDLLNPEELPTVKKHDLICTMLFSHGLTEGLAHTKNHAECLSKLQQSIDAASEFGFPNVVCFPGNRYGIAEEDGIKNTVDALKRIIGHAEEKNITLCMEYLNSKVDHKDYMFDNIGFGVEVCKQVGSENCKILYDVYHAQIMEGDIIRTIQDYHQYIGHYHTGGVPGRNEIDETQELYYPAIMRAILKTGFAGYVAHEFVPKAPDPVKSLAQAIEICDV